jgi:hypothetical protein
LDIHVSSIQQITDKDDPEELALTAARNEALLKKALFLAQRRAAKRRPIIREILRAGEVEGLPKNLNLKVSTIYFKVKKYNCSWVMSWSWSDLVDTTPDEEAINIIETVTTNLHMQETNTWPN